MIERIKTLVPVADDLTDQQTCRDLGSILANIDIDVDQLAEEIEQRVRPKKFLNTISQVFGYFDKKADKAIEAAASTATKQILTAGP